MIDRVFKLNKKYIKLSAIISKFSFYSNVCVTGEHSDFRTVLRSFRMLLAPLASSTSKRALH